MDDGLDDEDGLESGKNTTARNETALNEKSALNSIRTKLYTFCIQEVESDIWFCLCVKNPQIQQKNSPYHEASLDIIADTTLQAVVKNIYSLFRLLHGDVQTYFDRYGREKLVILISIFNVKKF